MKSSNGLALEFASERLRNDYDIVMKAVSGNGLALEFARTKSCKKTGNIIDRKVLGFGYGYKLLRTEKFKASNEFSIAQLNTDTISEMILRNSLWFSYKVSTNVNFTNKLLYEEGSESEVFIRNETSLNYNFENGTILSLNNTYTEDPVDNNVLSISLGRKW